MLKHLLTGFIFLLSFHNSYAIYEVTDNCKKAWMLVMDLQIDQAKTLLAGEIKRKPDNYYLYYLDQTCDAFKLLINSTDKDYEAFVENYNHRREIMNGKDEDSPYYLSCYAEMEIQVAVFSVMHGSQFAGIKKGYAAYKDVYRNLARFPKFSPNKKLDGFFNVAIANMPPFVKWAVSAFGVKVDIKYGFKTLFENYQSQKNIPGLNAESALYIILAAKINKTPEMLYDFTKSLDTSISNTFIHRYFRANICYWSGKNEEGIRTLQQTNPKESPHAGIIYNYMMGKMMLRKFDKNTEGYFLGYLNHLEKKEYLKEINYNLGLWYLLNGDQARYRKQCEVVKTRGMDLNERDREALYDARLDYIPDVNLVKARLSLEGGYTDSFTYFLAAYEASPSKVPGHELEYLLLKGKKAALASNYPLAMANFRKVIELGESRNYYFACEAAYRLGELCQKTGQASQAKEYYKKSMKLYKKEYYEILDDKATKAYHALP